MTCKDCHYYKNGKCRRPGLSSPRPCDFFAQICGDYVRPHKKNLMCAVRGHQFGEDGARCICARCGISADTKDQHDLHTFKRGKGCYEFCSVCGAMGRRLDHEFETCRCKYCGFQSNEKHRFRLMRIESYWKTSYCDKDPNFDGGVHCTYCTERNCSTRTLWRDYVYRCEVCGKEDTFNVRLCDGKKYENGTVYIDDPALTDAAADAAIGA